MTREENFNLLIYLYEIHKKFLNFLLNVNNFIIFNYLRYWIKIYVDIIKFFSKFKKNKQILITRLRIFMHLSKNLNV